MSIENAIFRLQVMSCKDSMQKNSIPGFDFKENKTDLLVSIGMMSGSGVMSKEDGIIHLAAIYELCGGKFDDALKSGDINSYIYDFLEMEKTKGIKINNDNVLKYVQVAIDAGIAEPKDTMIH